MAYWGIMLFSMGMLALADYAITGGEVFGPVNSIMFLILSFAILIRVRKKQKEGLIEKLQADNQELHQMLSQRQRSANAKEKILKPMA